MEIENKLDEDFLFYLGFIRTALEKIKTDENLFELCQAWLQKLCGEIAQTKSEKRNRNVYLSNLLLGMEEMKLTKPFDKMPPEVLEDSATFFGPSVPIIEEPEWMKEVLQGDDVEETTGDARTYIATKALPNGKGALGYIAISLDEDAEAPVGGLDEHLAEKFQELVPPLTDIERLLMSRRNPEARERVIRYFKNCAKDVAKEIDGLIPKGSNPKTQSMLKQLIEYLKQKGEWKKYETLCDAERHLELLFLLDSRLQERIMHIQRREEFLDDIEKSTLNQSFFETSLLPEDIHQELRVSRAGKMWTEAINAGPSKKLIRELTGKYPPFVTKKFLTLLANEKEKIAIKIQRRHENIFSQLKKELRKEGVKGRENVEKVQESHDEVVEVRNAVKAAEEKAYQSHLKRKEYLTGHRKERDEMYEQVRNAMLETQQHVEEEAQYGKYLTDQINIMNAQNQVYQEINEESLRKLEDANIEVMKDIKRLSKLIKQHEQRITQMKTMMQKSSTLEEGSKFFYV